MAATKIACICRDCSHCQIVVDKKQQLCENCGSPRLLMDEELENLHIAHIDCDAFYAAVEKRDHPEWRNKPLIVGGKERGVVSTCCYLARLHGVHSAMPMSQALRLCPEAVVTPPRMAHYLEVSKVIKQMFLQLTPAVEPISIDEAFLDLSGTEKLHHLYPAAQLVALARKIKSELGITISIGLSHNKFLAKLASDMNKPEGFTVINHGRTQEILDPLPVKRLWGAGPVTCSKLEHLGIKTFAELRRADDMLLMKNFGNMGHHFKKLAQGQDSRSVTSSHLRQSVSTETTLFQDEADLMKLKAHLWRLTLSVARQLKSKKLAGQTVTVKIKTPDFHLRTMQCPLQDPSQLAEKIYSAALPLLEKLVGAQAVRLIGVGVSHLCNEKDADPLNLADPDIAKIIRKERALDVLEEKFGPTMVERGIVYRLKDGKEKRSDKSAMRTSTDESNSTS